MKILLIDDDAFLRDMYATKFTEGGDEVSAASGGQEALGILSHESFDVIIVDMIMPGMSGLEFLEQLHNDSKPKNCKWIVLSNQGEKSDIDAAVALGVDGYIIKAESIPSEVVAKVHNIVT